MQTRANLGDVIRQLLFNNPTHAKYGKLVFAYRLGSDCLLAKPQTGVAHYSSL